MVPEDLFYTRDHEWVRFEQGDGATIGITDHAQQALGDVTFVELPKVGRTVAPGDACAVVESVKAASDIFAPVAGRVVAVNDALAGEPERVNRDPYGEGWICRLSVCDRGAAALMTAAAYAALLEQT